MIVPVVMIMAGWPIMSPIIGMTVRFELRGQCTHQEAQRWHWRCWWLAQGRNSKAAALSMLGVEGAFP
jgi:hypothetical protein